MNKIAASVLIAIATVSTAFASSPNQSFQTAGQATEQAELNVLLGDLSSRADVTNLKVLAFEDGSSAITWNDDSVRGYAISLDGQTIDTVRDADDLLRLVYAEFDPTLGEPEIDAALRSDGHANVFIVQTITQPLEAYRTALRDAGATIRFALGDNAFLVTGDNTTRATVSTLPFVRWVGEYHPAYRLESFIRENILSGTNNEAQPFSIMMLETGPAMKNVVADQIESIGGNIDKNVAGGFLIEATLTPDQLVEVAKLDEVLFIDRRLPVVDYMDNVRIVGGANYIESVAGYTGAGVRGEVMDSNLRTTHLAFQTNPPIIHGGTGGDSSHGTSVYGIVFGNGAGGPTGRGLLPNGQGIFADYGFLGDRYLHTGELVSAPYNAVFQTNSWGSCCFTSYTTNAADIDLALFDHDLLLLQAQANTGNNLSDVIAFAKNLVSVGGIRHANTSNLNDDNWSNAGSIGPGPDGRIKPDLCFWYDSILTTSNSNDSTYTPSFGGTSAATPMTAGHFGLFFQMWADGIFGNPVTSGATVFENRPHMSTAKAMMINCATPYPFVGTGADLTRVHQGWGRPDVKNLYDRRDSFFIINETEPISNLQTHSYQLTVAPSESVFRATLVYTDPPGAPSSSINRINDLSLRVIAPNATTYWGNTGMTSGNVTTPGGVANTVDTVENVWIENPTPGTWTVEVVASTITTDSHIETPAVDADYALVVSGIVSVIADGDMNCDSVVDGRDIAPFVQAMLDPAGYATAFPSCNQLRGDFDGNSSVGIGDVSAFVVAVLGD